MKTKEQHERDKELFDRVLMALYNRPGEEEIIYCAVGFAEETLEKLDDKLLEYYKDNMIQSIKENYPANYKSKEDYIEKIKESKKELPEQIQYDVDESDITFIFTKDLDVLTGLKEDFTLEYLKENV